MRPSSKRHQQRIRGRRPRASRQSRRGFALAIALLFVFAIGAIATGAIMLGSNSTLLSNSIDREREMRYATEAGLQFGKSRLNAEPSVLPDTGMVSLMSDSALVGADGQPMSDVHVNVWLAQTGSTTGQYGHFASVLSQAVDARGTGYVRRLELTQESFAKFAYWTNSETNGGTTIYFANGDQIHGPVFSNDIIHIDNSGATFFDNVATAKTISGLSYGTFKKGYQQRQKKITLPTDASLSKLATYGADGNMSFTAPTTGDESTVLMRIEFSPADLDHNGDSTGVDEGFIRVYQAKSGNADWLRGDWPGYGVGASNLLNCGDWHKINGEMQFFPASVHGQSWFNTLLNAQHVSNDAGASLYTIMKHSNSRCFLGGDPHLVAVERTSSTYPNAADRQKGGDDTTFTPSDPYGAWKLYTSTPNASVASARPADAKYLIPLYRGLNTGSKGVIYVNGTVGVSGVVRGKITLYAHKGTIVVLDNTRYTADPSQGVCLDMLGLIADNDIVVADNALLDPQTVKSGSYVSMNSTNYLTLQAVMMALNTSFRVENYDGGTSNFNDCQGSNSGRGCLYLTGGVIQLNRGAVGLTSGQGYIKRYTYDHCAALNPPPYFPTTGRFDDNKYLDVNPIGFDAQALFTILTPAP